MINLYKEELNQFFKNSTKALNILENSYVIDKSELSDPVNKAISICDALRDLVPFKQFKKRKKRP